MCVVLLGFCTQRLLGNPELRFGCPPSTPLEGDLARLFLGKLLMSLSLGLSSWASQVCIELSFSLLPGGSYEAWLPAGSFTTQCEDFHSFPHFW